MKSLFNDNRPAVLLQQFRSAQSLSVNSLASRLQVSDRTIRNDIKQLNETLDGSALIDGQKGQYTLRVFDPVRFQKLVDEISETDDFLNSPRNRMRFGIRLPNPLQREALFLLRNISLKKCSIFNIINKS